MKLFLAFILMTSSWANDLKVVKVTKNISFLMGKGGNIGVSTGRDGVFLIDDKYADMHDGVIAKVKTLSPEKIKFVINTHWHGDHTGGNEKMGKKGSILVAHENVRKRLNSNQFMKAFNRKVEKSPEGALPKITFTRDIKFHLNGDDIEVFHLANAHTDGDSVVHFTKSNVIHTGDIFFHEMFPFIDASSKGSIGGMIIAVDKILAKCDNKTKIIPGHGPLATKSDLQAYRKMLTESKEVILAKKKEGKSVEDIVKMNVLKKYHAKMGDGHFKTHQFIGFIYSTL